MFKRIMKVFEYIGYARAARHLVDLGYYEEARKLRIYSAKKDI